MANAHVWVALFIYLYVTVHYLHKPSEKPTINKNTNSLQKGV